MLGVYGKKSMPERLHKIKRMGKTASREQYDLLLGNPMLGLKSVQLLKSVLKSVLKSGQNRENRNR
jgi:hypothetical protein